VIEPAPGAALETKSSFQAGYVGLDAGSEVFQLAVGPAALDHGVDRQGALFVEGDILDTQRLGLLQIVEAGVAAITGRLSRRRTLARDVALEHGKETLGIGRVAGLDDDIEDQAALAGGQVQLVPVVHLAAALDDNIRVRLEQANQLLAARHRLAGEDAALGLVDDALDQGQIMPRLAEPQLGVDRGACKSRRSLAKVLLPARAHRQAVAELPLDILLAAARDKSQPIELRLAAAKAAAPYFHARISTGPPKASFEMTAGELEAAIAREKEHALRVAPGQHPLRVVR
jgi:hypothetical protein